jgi:8-oxo-dGTP pyrophosphatase MutT (NUDIX family)
VHRRHLNELLARYAAAWPSERALADRFAAFAAAHADCLLRTCIPGHITASCWILSADDTCALLTHHRKLDRWLQLGGHVDGEPRIERAALREAQEESGMQRFELLGGEAGAVVPLDLDVHPIPARGAEPRHDHWDVRFLLRAGREQDLAISAESVDLRWFPLAEVERATSEESVLRLQRKAAAVLARGGRAVRASG